MKPKHRLQQNVGAGKQQTVTLLVQYVYSVWNVTQWL